MENWEERDGIFYKNSEGMLWRIKPVVIEPYVYTYLARLSAEGWSDIGVSTGELSHKPIEQSVQDMKDYLDYLGKPFDEKGKWEEFQGNYHCNLGRFFWRIFKVEYGDKTTLSLQFLTLERWVDIEFRGINSVDIPNGALDVAVNELKEHCKYISEIVER